MLSGIQRAAQTVLGVYLKRTCSRDTSASSALGVLNDYALYKSTHSLTHSLSHSKARTLPATPRPQHSRPKPRPPKVRTKPRPELCDLRPTPRPQITGQSNLTRGAPRVVQAILPLFLVFGIYCTQFVSYFENFTNPPTLSSRVVSVRRCRVTALRHTVHTRRASVQQAAKLVAALLRVAGVTAGLADSRPLMTAYRRVYDSRHLQADCQEAGSAPEPYAR